ncbi:MAG: 1-aminocyclopropane-1-carboxylate deaminase/D-cysteine desulfhydrase [Bacteroidetes bacterium]|nr:1-aminocyclopropane-1-carboxylate deaminase/D-cysteine desulfhydrase [Bacteroidota bacterium]
MQFIQELKNSLLSEKQVKAYVLRLDLIHPTIGGNKYFKLKYNLEQAKAEGKKTILSFGGAFSNHIAALAAAGHEFGFNTIGVIRGDELSDESNPTLRLAKQNGMQFHFVERETYRKRDDVDYNESLKQKIGDFYLVPEGGSNALAVRGCSEIINHIPIDFDTIMCACGTGGTISGIALSINESQKAIGIPVLKGAEFLVKEILQFQSDYNKTQSKLHKSLAPQLIYDYHFGGYANTNSELLQFMEVFENEYSIPLDKIYTSKLMFAFFDLLKKDFFRPNSSLVLVHTGGLQGN